jgi:hypothetical protein
MGNENELIRVPLAHRLISRRRRPSLSLEQSRGFLTGTRCDNNFTGTPSPRGSRYVRPMDITFSCTRQLQESGFSPHWCPPTTSVNDEGTHACQRMQAEITSSNRVYSVLHYPIWDMVQLDADHRPKRPQPKERNKYCFALAPLRFQLCLFISLRVER